MMTNLDKFRKDISALKLSGTRLLHAMQLEAYNDEFIELIKRKMGNEEKALAYIENLPTFRVEYQSWYSESLALIRQILPDRLSDFTAHYEKPKGRKELYHSTYVILDFIQNTICKNGYGEITVSSTSAIPHLEQQIAIIAAAQRRFESSLFEIRQLVQADLFDSELGSAKELNRHKFTRAAGAVAGVVLEKHLHQVCSNHHLTVTKKNPTINDLNQLLRENDVIDIPQWRFNQHLADKRNLCDHSKTDEPTAEEVKELIDGVDKVLKTIF